MGHSRKKIATFVITNKCNLKCRYCWVNFEDNNYPKKVLDIDFAKKGLDDFFKETKSNYIGFFASGEPTTEMETMDEILKYAKYVVGKPKVELQTNGVFGDKVLSWILQNIDILWVSADGPIEINDLNRRTINNKGTGAIIESNIKELIFLRDKYHKDLTIGIRSTIGNFNVHGQRRLIDYYRELGVRTIFVDQICVPVQKHRIDPMLGALDSNLFAETFYEAYIYANNVGVFYSTMAMMNFDEPVKIACRSLLPMPHFTPEGFVASCEMCYATGTDLDVFIYGEWDPLIKEIRYMPEKIDFIRSRTIENLNSCHGCRFLENCAGSCAGESLNETGEYYRCTERLCTIVKYLGDKIERNVALYPYLHP